MNVAHLIDTLSLGGAQKLLVTYAEAARQRGLPATALSLRSDRGAHFPAEIEAQGGRVMMFDFHRLVEPRKFLKLAGFLRRGHFDILHSHLIHANILAPLLGRLLNIPVVVTLHSINLKDGRYYKPALDRLEILSLRYGAHRVQAVGSAVAAAHRARLGGRPVTVIPNAFSPVPPLAPSKRSELRTQLMPDPRRRLLLAAGRLESPKAYPDLLAAFAIVRGLHPDVHLAIAGEGSLKDDLVGLVRSLGLEQSVSLLGFRSDVPDLLGAADMYVLSSHWEGLPIALLEAMAVGLPVAATAVGDIVNTVVEGTGCLVPPGHPDQLAAAIAGLLADPARARAMGERARAHVIETFGMERWMDRLLSMYEDMRARS
jgi:glycosyltransferase involved in cell wall biosynthesis